MGIWPKTENYKNESNVNSRIEKHNCKARTGWIDLIGD
jgi:hypothetical protein